MVHRAMLAVYGCSRDACRDNASAQGAMYNLSIVIYCRTPSRRQTGLCWRTMGAAIPWVSPTCLRSSMRYRMPVVHLKAICCRPAGLGPS